MSGLIHEAQLLQRLKGLEARIAFFEDQLSGLEPLAAKQRERGRRRRFWQTDFDGTYWKVQEAIFALRVQADSARTEYVRFAESDSDDARLEKLNRGEFF